MGTFEWGLGCSIPPPPFPLCANNDMTIPSWWMATTCEGLAYETSRTGVELNQNSTAKSVPAMQSFMEYLHPRRRTYTTTLQH